MIKLIDILTEGVYDPGIFKAVFTAGGPGSGKSYVASTLFGMPEKMPFVSAKGLKSVNSDKYFETYLKMSGLSQDIAKMNPAEYELLKSISTVDLVYLLMEQERTMQK